MRAETLTFSKVTTAHLAQFAYVYIRQSSLGQVLHHRESTDIQYQLVERATQLGWPSDRVQVIDEDLGKSGASADHRSGFHSDGGSGSGRRRNGGTCCDRTGRRVGLRRR